MKMNNRLPPVSDFSHSFSVIIDLCDEKGNMKKLFENPESYANEFLSERDSFILIKVESK